MRENYRSRNTAKDLYIEKSRREVREIKLSMMRVKMIKNYEL